MGPSNPWSPDWRPDPTGGRLLTIRVARRGAYLAAAIYLPIGIIAASLVATPLVGLPSTWSAPIAALALLSGLPGIALLGAGLAPAALGSRIDAVAVAVALAVGAPVAATASFVISGWIIDSWVGGSSDFAAPFLRAGVSAAVQVAPLVALGATAWVVLLRRFSSPLPPPPPSAPTRP
jgi:hypothetical protein